MLVPAIPDAAGTPVNLADELVEVITGWGEKTINNLKQKRNKKMFYQAVVCALVQYIGLMK